MRRMALERAWSTWGPSGAFGSLRITKGERVALAVGASTLRFAPRRPPGRRLERIGEVLRFARDLSVP